MPPKKAPTKKAPKTKPTKTPKCVMLPDKVCDKDLNKTQLLQLAKECGLNEVKQSMTKKEICAQLNKVLNEVKKDLVKAPTKEITKQYSEEVVYDSREGGYKRICQDGKCRKVELKPGELDLPRVPRLPRALFPPLDRPQRGLMCPGCTRCPFHGL